MRQAEVSRTLVLAAPRRSRGLFEALVADNLDIGPLPFALDVAHTWKTTAPL
jgi:hypothetical protein